MKHREPLEDWEKELHGELMRLPELEAPSTLIPAVLNRIPTPASTPWYQSSWWDWPVAVRRASAALVVGVLGMFGWLGLSLGELEFAQALIGVCAELKRAVVLALEAWKPVSGSGTAFWSQYGQTILIAASAILLATYLTCVAAGTALYQLAWRRSL